MTDSDTTSTSSVLAFRYIQGTKSTQSKCFICDSAGGRKSVPWSAIRQAWFKLNYYIPKTNRICPRHLDENQRFTEEALLQIEATKQGIHVTSFDFGLWLHEVSDMPISPPFSFNQGGVESGKYKTWLGLEKTQFEDLLSYLPETEMRNTSARSVRNGLAMFLLLLRNNLKQEVIAEMFGTTQQVVSRTIDKVSLILEREFVPKYLGYYHITREEALEKHSRSMSSRAIGQPLDHICIVIDCTYIYIEKPTDFTLQRKTFSLHKKRNLIKPMLIVFPNGYILEAAGPYFCDSSNNDAAIILHHYENSDLLLFLEEWDNIFWDRGYKYAEPGTAERKILSHMPALLSKTQQQFTAQQANDFSGFGGGVHVAMSSSRWTDRRRR
ncbi:hypothetical protein Fcan01_21665 [Folsomia candida]|uniref:DDE Tnp4 domain-containing protein n=1 Tax=Folsomia candida TaxID=158441 RepID=A0A226DI47_FOLCA|nr:hypothetical protein Fcan01_21665 [Folsomia candida]